MQITPRAIVDENFPGDNEFEVIQSSYVLLPVINDLGLDKTWAKRYKSDQDRLPPVESLEHMNKVLKLDLKRGTNIVVVTVQREVPKEASDIANAVMDRYKSLRDAEEYHRNTSFIQSPVRIIIRAMPPKTPSQPNRAFCLALSLAGGCLFGFVAAFGAAFVAFIAELELWRARPS